MPTNLTPQDPPPPLTVNVSVAIRDNAIYVDCEPSSLPVPLGTQYVMLRFVMQSDAYEFPAVGAVTLQTTTSQFPLPSWTEPGGRIARLFDFNTSASETPYLYTVSVVPIKPYTAVATIKNGAPVP